ncbi:polysaccharide biosynthesis protein [Flavicella marina]|uniref:polysaccharide biosynthesis protein n=1 Tax=Flavicella marina TaxID=1475951 RepID=UPI001265107D|nr:nucleoside-diphosphate sugar epimerase/dehydratase [Flavicella marina]
MKKILNSYTKRHVSRWLVLSIDVFLIIQLFLAAYFIRFNFTLSFDLVQTIYEIPLIGILAVLSFMLAGSYKGIIRHTGIKDALNVYVGVSLLCGFLVFSVLLNRVFDFSSTFTIPISIIVIHYLLNIIVLISSRFVYKYMYRTLVSSVKQPSATLIYGAGEMGAIAYNTLQKGARELYKVVGFVDDNISRAGQMINRMPIYHGSEITDEFVRKYQVKEVVVAIQKIKPRRLLEIVDDMKSLGVEVKIAPPISRWVGGHLDVGQIKPVRIEDLLNRAPINLSNQEVRDELTGKVVFVTGAAGSIGGEISQQITSYDCEKVVLIDQSESALYDLEQELKRGKGVNFEVQVADIRDSVVMDHLFQTKKPDFVFHAAAYKHVPLMEENPYQAVRTNVQGTANIIDLSVKYEVSKFVMVSTDKAVNPTNVMGATKRIAEMYASSMNEIAKGKTKFITTRFGNVLGSNGSVIPLFKKQIENGGPLTLTHRDITRYFMTIPEACQLVIEAGCMGKGGEIFIFDMGKSVKIFDLAKRMIQLSGLRYPEDIDIKITGLRPGEKLYEELLNDKEATLPTHHEKIMIGKVRALNSEETIFAIRTLCEENTITSPQQTVSRMKEIVPEFLSQNSIYTELDIVKNKFE